MGRGRKLNRRAIISATVLALSAGSVFAQTLDSPITASLSFSSNVTANTNKFLAASSPGTTVDISEQLSFSLVTRNSLQLLEITGSASLNFDDIGSGASADFRPRVTLHYARGTGNSNLDASASIWKDTVVSSFDLDPTEAVFIIVDTGTLTTIGADLAFNTGVEAPLGFSFTASYKDDDYDGTSDPELFDSTTVKIGASAKLRLSPTTQGTLSASFTDFESSALPPRATKIQTTVYNIGVSHAATPALTIDGNIGFRDEETNLGGAPTTIDGIFGGIGVVRDLPRGTIFGRAKVDDSGSAKSGSAKSKSLTFGGTLDIEDGSLTASLEADKTEGNDVQLLGNVAFRRDLPSGSVTVDLNQSLSTDSLDQDIRVSSLGIDYNRTLAGDAGLNLALDLSRREDAGAGSAETLDRATVSATYSRELTSDWDVLLGYSHRLSSGSALATANSDSIFLTLTRSIQFGF